MQRIACVSACVVMGLAAVGCGLTEKFPARAIFVANGGSDTIQVIDPEDGRVVGEIALDPGFHPHHLSISPDGTKLAVAAPSADLSAGHGGDHSNAKPSKVYLFDTESGAEKASIDVEATVHNVAFLDDFETVAFAMMEHGMISARDAGKLDEQWTATTGAMPLEVTAVNGRLLVANSGDGTLSIIDQSSHAGLDTADVGDTPVAVWNTPSGLFVSLEGDKKVAILSSTNLKDVTGTWDVGGVPGVVASAKSGGDVWIAVEDRGVVEVRDPATGDVTQTVDVGGKPHGLWIDAKAGLVYVTDEGGSRVIRVDATKYTVKDEIEVGDAPNGIVQGSL